MKKILSVSLCLAVLFTTVACTSSRQARINAAFDKVYANYADTLTLAGAKSYTVQKDDSLTDIAKKFYGAEYGYYFPVILLASKETISDPDLIKPGMKLLIPDLQSNLESKAIRSKLKLYFRDISTIYYDKKGDEAVKTRKELQAISESL